MTIFSTLEIGKKALRAQMKGTEVSGQNVANANTPGYTRQRVIMESVVPAAAPGVDFSPGWGVAVADITRMKSEFYHTQMMNTGSQLAHWKSREEALRGVETIFKEPGDFGLAEHLEEFFDVWNELSSNPESMAVRMSLREHTHTFTGAVRDTYLRLEDLRLNTRENLANRVEGLNQILEEVAKINGKLNFIYNLGEKSNELVDQLDLRLEDLSELVDLRVHRKDSGAVEVYTSGTLLVQDEDTFPLRLIEKPGGEMALFTHRERQIDPRSGNMRGGLEAVNQVLPGLQGGLDYLVSTMAERVNRLHLEGYDLNGEEGGTFFQEINPESETPPSLQLSLTPEISEAPSRIAAATHPGEPGNGENSLAISRVRDERLMKEGTTTIIDYYRGVVTSIGVEGQESRRAAQALEKAESELRKQNYSVSGVNLDEEMLNMVKFQHAWHGAARFLNYVDDMIGTLFHELGR